MSDYYVSYKAESNPGPGILINHTGIIEADCIYDVKDIVKNRHGGKIWFYHV